jgi:hypothetical protein
MEGPDFPLFGEGGNDFFLFFPCSQGVPMSSSSSQVVPPKTFPIAPQIYTILWCTQSSTFVYIITRHHQHASSANR